MGVVCDKPHNSGNISKSIKRKIKKATQENFISLRNMGIHTIPHELQNLNIKTIDLGINQIEQFALEISIMSNLQNLILERNLIERLPVISSSSLRVLYLSDNRIGSISGFDLPRLKTLNLNNNYLKSLRRLVGCPNLEILEVQNNLLITLSQFIMNLQYLQRANFSENQISDLNIHWKITSLFYLDLSNNKIQFIPQEMLENSGLTHIRLLGNEFQAEDFLSMPGVEAYLQRRQLIVDKRLWDGVPLCKYILD